MMKSPEGVIRGVSFSPYRAGDDPLQERFPSAESIDRDLQVVANRVNRVRTYSSLDGMDQIPRLAKKYKLKVTAGAWLDSRKERNERELRNLVRTARAQSNVERLIVGNETIRAAILPAELGKILRKIRRQVSSRQHGRTLACMDSLPAAGARRRFHRGPHPAVLGGRPGRPGHEVHG
jgi:exo-beta-1,3-glucanase (GH17 family)